MELSLPLISKQKWSISDLPAVQVGGLYVHVPFCFHKCHYCDFYSITRQPAQRMAGYVDRILAEADQWASGSGPVLRPTSTFFGGGTPSLLPLEQICRLIDGLRRRFDFSELDEWTVEVNPATASREYLQALHARGVNRISLGAQSFDRHELATLERHHQPDDVARSIELAREAGFRRINIDLIYAIPGQSLQSWKQSLETAIELGLTHYSCYGLTYEPNTPLGVKKRLGQLQPAEEELELDMLGHTRRRLKEIGCPAYEISNYAVSGQECRQNLLYWKGKDYIGLGPSAASHIKGHRFKNLPHLGEWESAIDRGQLPLTEAEALSPRQRAAELVMLLLRLSEGLNFDDYSACTGFDARMLFVEQIERLGAAGLLEVDQRGFRLSERGIPVADAVMAEFVRSEY